jgi:hypothetical protein
MGNDFRPLFGDLPTSTDYPAEISPARRLPGNLHPGNELIASGVE